jgi:hypothetical protein
MMLRPKIGGAAVNLLNLRVLFLAGCVGALAWYAGWLPAPRREVSGQVHGRAVDVYGRGVAGARVTVRDASGKVWGETRAEVDGSFMVTGCDPGTYKVYAAKTGIGSGEREVTVARRRSTETLVALTGSLSK